MPDYSLLDQPGLIKFLFFPRKYHTACPANAFDTAFPVDRDVSITCRFHVAGRDLPWVLYFHGNGEVVSDYDQIAPIYNEIGLNMVVADYRG
ncbi:MAG: alpha/beta hydrolase, partial [Bacillota bacterium]